MKPLPPSRSPLSVPWTPIRKRSTSTAARSPWATPLVPPAPSSPRNSSTSCSAATKSGDRHPLHRRRPGHRQPFPAGVSHRAATAGCGPKTRLRSWRRVTEGSCPPPAPQSSPWAAARSRGTVRSCRRAAPGATWEEVPSGGEEAALHLDQPGLDRALRAAVRVEVVVVDAVVAASLLSVVVRGRAAVFSPSNQAKRCSSQTAYSGFSVTAKSAPRPRQQAATS